MPGIRGKTLKRNATALPLLRCVVEDTPRVAIVIGLPSEVVSIPICGLLALKFDCLGSICKFRRNEEIQVIAEIADRIGNRGLLDEVVAAGVRRTAVDVKVRCRSTEAGVRNPLVHVIVGSLFYASDVTAAAAGLPSVLILDMGNDHCACRDSRCASVAA